MIVLTNKIAVLLMTFGTPATLTDIEGYYTHIRRGHQPSAELLKQLQQRYQAIGGTSPLADITKGQFEGISSALKEINVPVDVFVGQRHAAPFIEELVTEICQAGYSEIYGVPLAAHYSSYSASDYHQAAKTILSAYPQVQYHEVDGFEQQPDLLDFWVQELQQRKSLWQNKSTKVIFSAHSLPLKTLTTGDPYQQLVIDNAASIAAMVQLPKEKYVVAWQSAGRTKDAWIGPDFMEVSEALVKNDGIHDIISVPIGFINNNLEINYDIDIELQQKITAVGGCLTRVSMPNTDNRLIQAVTKRIVTALVQK